MTTKVTITIVDHEAAVNLYSLGYLLVLESHEFNTDTQVYELTFRALEPDDI